MQKLRSCLKFLSISLLFLAVQTPAQAGLFNMSRFVEPGKNAVGFEPEVTLTNGGGVSGAVRYTQGLTELNNLHLQAGMGSGVRKFRIGGAFTFDFFPDVNDQPGIGLGLQGIYYRYKYDFGQLETAAVPYVHKTFHSGTGNEIEPFLAVPFGPAFHDGEYIWTTQVVMGAIFRRPDTVVQFIGEIGVNVNKTESYFSGGILYQP